MKFARDMSVILVAGAMALASTQANAVTSTGTVEFVGANSGSGVPGGTPVKTSFTVQFSGPYDFIGVGFSLTYDPAYLSFNAAESAVIFNDVSRTFPQFLTDLSDLSTQTSGSFLSDLGDIPGEVYLNAGFTESGSLPLVGTLTVQTAFNLISPAFGAGTSKTVTVESLVFVDSLEASTELSPLGNPITMTISAVPEAETWLMMLAGLGLLGAVARRRVR